jgi:hypothetical protein
VDFVTSVWALLGKAVNGNGLVTLFTFAGLIAFALVGWFFPIGAWRLPVGFAFTTVSLLVAGMLAEAPKR